MQNLNSSATPNCRFFTMFSASGTNYIKFRMISVFLQKNIEILKIIERLALVKFKAAPSDGSGSISSGPVVSPGSVQNSSTGSSGMQTMGTGQSTPGSTALNQSSS